MYINCHSYHSLRYGTIPLNELVQQAASCGVETMALTDINTVTGIYDFIKECKNCCYKTLLELSFDTTINYYIGLAKRSEPCKILQ
jgi:DNA polymerase-3 subunit alpha/error-prone DNA polymerase